MAVPALLDQVGLELLANDPPDVQVLSHDGLAQISPFLPGRVHALLKAQLDVFGEEVARPVMAATTVAEALDRLSARSDVVAAVRVGIGRVLVESIRKSDELGAALGELPVQRAKELRSVTLRWCGRYSALVFEGAVLRASISSRRYFRFAREVFRTLPSQIFLGSLLTQPTFAQVPSLGLAVEGLLMCLLFAVEQARQIGGDPPASPVIKGLIEALWRAVYQHERAMLQWLLGCGQFLLASPYVVVMGSLSTVEDILTELRQASDTGHVFAELRQEWHAATGHLANPNQIVAHPAYRAIVELGWQVTPYIFQSLADGEHDFWGPALHELTGEEPALQPGEQDTLSGIGSAWLALARQRGWRIGGVDAAGR